MKRDSSHAGVAFLCAVSLGVGFLLASRGSDRLQKESTDKEVVVEQLSTVTAELSHKNFRLSQQLKSKVHDLALARAVARHAGALAVEANKRLLADRVAQPRIVSRLVAETHPSQVLVASHPAAIRRLVVDRVAKSRIVSRLVAETHPSQVLVASNPAEFRSIVRGGAQPVAVTANSRPDIPESESSFGLDRAAKAWEKAVEHQLKQAEKAGKREDQVALGEEAAWRNENAEVVVPGTIQHVLGGSDWDPNGQCSRMAKKADGVYVWSGTLPAGEYEFKIAAGGSWSRNWGDGFTSDGPNIPLPVTKTGQVKIVANFNERRISVYYRDENGSWLRLGKARRDGTLAASIS